MDNIWRSTRVFVYRRILHADDTPHRIALGVALATFVAFTPTMGLQTVIALSLAALLRANKAVCLPFVWITNPFTFVPIYWSCWQLGASIMPTARVTNEMAIINKLQGYTDSGLGFISGLFSYEFWAGMFQLMLELGSELWVGCGIVGLVSGVIAYFTTKWIVVTYRARRRERSFVRRRKRTRSRKPARKAVIAGKSA